MVFNIFACVALFLSVVNTLFLGSIVYVSTKRINAEKERLNNIKNTFFGVIRLKLTIFKKIILVSCVVSVLFIGMVVPCFASSGGQQIGYLQPLFCPSSFTNLSSDYSYGGICDIPNSFYFGGNGGYQSSVTWDQDMFNDMNVVGDVTLSSNTLQSGYGYSYINADFYSHLTLSSSNQVNTNLAFYYDDVYLPYQLIQNNSVKLNWLSDLTFSFEGATPTITRISFKINYINKDNDRFTQKSKTASLQYDGLIDTSRGVTDIIYN